jgi:hypothetical protein
MTPARMNLQQTNRPIDCLLYWQNKGHLYMDTPYQRGDVWGPIRQQNLIRSLLIGIPVPSIIVNDRMAANWVNDYRMAVIDGKQRMTAILRFLNGELAVPGEWFGLSGEVKLTDLPEGPKRRIHNTPIAFSEGRLANEEEERQVFELVNFGGVPQGESDLLA